MAMAGVGAPELGAPSGGAPGPAQATQLELIIATGIGLHNFAKGLAIGSSAAYGQLPWLFSW